MAAPTADAELIINVDEESTGVPDKERKGVPRKNTGLATSDDGESIGLPITDIPYDDNMGTIDAAIAKVAATFDQGLREANVEPG